MKRLYTLLVISFFTLTCLFAQYDANDYFPLDTTVIKGKLDNGLTYYIKKNKEPENRASFYIIRDAGALLEEDHENGLAHFLEHMAFNGTSHFPGKGIISTLERYGVKFGANLNAYTSLSETVYNISDVPTTIPNLLDTCLLILKDWTYYLSLEEEEIDAERGVIVEEARQRRNANTRTRDIIYPVLMKGSKYVTRDVIGSMDVITNFEYKTLRDFYHKWYRTDLTAIAMVGDFNPKEMEEKFMAMFSDVPSVDNPEPVPFFEIPEHDEPRFVVATDEELRNSSIQLITLFRKGVKPEEMNYSYFRNSFVEGFYNAMIANRVSETMTKPNPPYMSAGISCGGFVKGYKAYSITATAMPDKEDVALRAILTENERVRRFGFLDSELERVKVNTLAGLESSYKQRDKTKNDQYVSPMKSNFLQGSPIVDFADYYEFAKVVIPTITAAEVSAKANEWVTSKNTTCIVSGPDNHKHLTEEEAFEIIAEVQSDPSIVAYEDSVSLAESLIEEELSGATVTAEKTLPQFDAVEWTLSNGAKVVYRKADYEKDRVALSSYSQGGTSLYDVDLLPAANNASGFVASFGKGDYDPVTLSKMLTGKIANVSPSIGSLYESVNGACAPKDFETMMQLVYMTFEQPRFDQTLYDNAMERSWLSLKNRYKNPQNVIQDSLSLILSNYHPRTRLLNESYLNDISLEKIQQVYTDRIKDASDFTFFIVGNIELETAKTMAQKYIGSIKSEYRDEKWVDNKVRGPKGKMVKRVGIKMEEPKSTVFVRLSNNKVKVTPYDQICFSVLQGVLQLRYTESIREEEGGTYGVRVGASSSREPTPNYVLEMSFNCEPERADALKPILYSELETIAKKGPKQEELDKTLENIRKNREQSKPHNAYWMNVIYNYYRTGVNNDDPKNFENIVDKITVKDIRKWLRKFKRKADVVDIIFYPE